MTSYLKIVSGALTGLLFLLVAPASSAQAPDPKLKASEKSSDKSASIPKAAENASFAFQIQLLETSVRFEANGDSRKEVHTVVKLNDLMGVREFARLTFDYNRSVQQVEIPLVRITHSNGGTSDVLPSAITDLPNPAVEKYPAYQDVRVKSVRILGLQEGDTIEYRVITATTHAPLAPEFWLEHTFDRSGQVLDQKYELEVPKARTIQMRTSPEMPAASPETVRSSDNEYVKYQWQIRADTSIDSKAEANQEKEPDIVLTTFSSWGQLSKRAYECVQMALATDIWARAVNKMNASNEPLSSEMLYDYVSSKITTVDLPLSFETCPFRNGMDVLNSGYGTPQDKAKLLAILLGQSTLQTFPKYPVLSFYSKSKSPESRLPRPSLLKGILVLLTEEKTKYLLDPSLEVAPFGVLPANLRGRKILGTAGCDQTPLKCWAAIPPDLPFRSIQKVNVEGSIDKDGKLKAKVKYTLRGDNELLLRIAFHQTAKEKWNDVAGLLALSDGFRGVITNVDASDPMRTKEPFTVEYELTQEKFVDWAKKPVRVPALLPQIGLPDSFAKTSAGDIELGTPLEVETQMTLHLPGGTTVQRPAGTAVQREYATYSSKYVLSGETLSATRHIHFLRREVAADRAVDYNAFARAVQNDQSQYFVLERGVGVKSTTVK